MLFRVVCEKFLQLTSGNPTLAKRKVLAGIVMTNDDDPEDMKVSFSIFYKKKLVFDGFIFSYIINHGVF